MDAKLNSKTHLQKPLFDFRPNSAEFDTDFESVETIEKCSIILPSVLKDENNICLFLYY